MQAIVLGVVQGLTEFLPISSTAHLRIVPAFCGWDDPGAAFTAVVQLGTMAAVLVYFRRELWDIGAAGAFAVARLAAGRKATRGLAVLADVLLALLGDRAKTRLQPVEVEGAEAVEQRMGRAVEVGRARRQQAALRAVLGDRRRLARVVGGVEGLDAVETELGEAVDPLDHRGDVGDVPERVRPDRDPAGFVHDLDRFRHRRRGPAPERRRARYQIGLEKLRGVHDPLALEAHPVGRMVEGSLSEVRPADRLPLGEVELQAAVAQRLGHADGARRAVGAEGGEGTEERDRPVVDEVAEDVQVLDSPVDRRELDRRHEAEATSRARLHRLVDAVHRVMVGERQQLHARVRGRRHDGPRWQRALTH